MMAVARENNTFTCWMLVEVLDWFWCHWNNRFVVSLH